MQFCLTYHLVNSLANWDGDVMPPPGPWAARGFFLDEKLKNSIEAWCDKSQITEQNIEIEKYIDTDHFGEIAPRAWILEMVDMQVLSVWWENHVLSLDSKQDLKPWWLLYTSPESQALCKIPAPSIRTCSTTGDEDKIRLPPTAAQAMLAGEERCKVKETSKVDHKLNAKHGVYHSEELGQTVVQPNPFAPRRTMYLRPARKGDVAQIVAIYKHYIDNTIYCPERDSSSVSKVLDIVEDVEKASLPFLVAIDSKSEADKVLGFGFADDWHVPRGMYRYTVEVELFVRPDVKGLRIGTCIMDKLMSVLDSHYGGREACEFYGNPLHYAPGGRRRLGYVICNVAFDSQTDRFEKLKQWLKQWDFEVAGILPEIGRKRSTRSVQPIFS